MRTNQRNKKQYFQESGLVLIGVTYFCSLWSCFLVVVFFFPCSEVCIYSKTSKFWSIMKSKEVRSGKEVRSKRVATS